MAALPAGVGIVVEIVEDLIIAHRGNYTSDTRVVITLKRFVPTSRILCLAAFLGECPIRKLVSDEE